MLKIRGGVSLRYSMVSVSDGRVHEVEEKGFRIIQQRSTGSGEPSKSSKYTSLMYAGTQGGHGGWHERDTKLSTV